MTHDPNIQLLMANARIERAQADAANDRLARAANGPSRNHRDPRDRGATGSGDTIVTLVTAPVRRLAAVASAVASRRHPAGKSA
jgi:hypothetical protein